VQPIGGGAAVHGHAQTEWFRALRWSFERVARHCLRRSAFSGFGVAAPAVARSSAVGNLGVASAVDAAATEHRTLELAGFRRVGRLRCIERRDRRILFVLHAPLLMHQSFREVGRPHAERALNSCDGHSSDDVEHDTCSKVERRHRRALVVAVHSTFVIGVEREWQ